MARNIPDLALFLDTMAGFCPHDPMTFDAPAVSFSAAVADRSRRSASPSPPITVAAVESTAKSARSARTTARRFEELGCIVEEASPDLGAVDEVFMALRSQHFVVDRELQLRAHRDKLKPDIIWNTERGFSQTTRQLAWAERERAAFYRRMVEFFGRRTTCWSRRARRPPAFDVNLRAPPTIGGKKLDNYMGGLDAQLRRSR